MTRRNTSANAQAGAPPGHSLTIAVSQNNATVSHLLYEAAQLGEWDPLLLVLVSATPSAAAAASAITTTAVSSVATTPAAKAPVEATTLATPVRHVCLEEGTRGSEPAAHSGSQIVLCCLLAKCPLPHLPAGQASNPSDAVGSARQASTVDTSC